MKVLAPCHTQGPTVAHGLSWDVTLRGGSPFREQWGRQGSGEGLCTGPGDLCPHCCAHCSSCLGRVTEIPRCLCRPRFVMSKPRMLTP